MAITSGKDWRSASDAQEITLPSGKVALLKKPDVLELIADQDMPDLITNQLMSNLTGAPAAKVEVKREDMPKMLNILNKMCKACFVEPRIVDNAAAEDEIELRHIDFNDKVAVLEFAFGQEGLKAQSFRSQPNAGVPTVSNGANLRAASKRGIGRTT